MPGPQARAVQLVNACLESGNEAAWSEFVRLFQPLIASVVLRVMQRFGKVDRALADDLIQETYVRLCRENCKALRSFEHRHEAAIFGFIKVVAASVAMDHFRARLSEKRASEDEAHGEDALATAPGPSPDLYDSLLVGEIASQLEQVANNDRDRSIFWLYYQHGYTARDISLIPGIQLTAKGVESALLRLTKAIRQNLNPQNMKNAKRSEGLSPSSSVGEVT